MYRKFKPPFFCPELYRRAREPSSARAFSENPGVASAGSGDAAVRSADWLAVAALAQTQTERRDFLTSSKSSGVMITNGNPNFLKAHIFIYRPIL
jgi:hypothetical protein